MEFKKILDSYKCNACIISVDTHEDGTYGNYLVVDGNKQFTDGVLELTKHPFVENSPYYMSLPKDMNFEDFMYRCAILHQPLHT